MAGLRSRRLGLPLALLLLVACTPGPGITLTAAPTVEPTVRPTPQPAASATPAPIAPAPAPTRPPCTLGAGFAMLERELGREIVGECVEDERANPTTGDVEQRTTRGILIWRKAENLSTFTNGATTFYACPAGPEMRPSAEQYGCGIAAAAPAPTAPPPRIAPMSPPGPSPAPATCPDAIPWTQAKARVGQRASVYGPVARANYARGSRGQPTFVDLGVGFPNPDRFTILIWVNARRNFPTPPEQLYAGKTVCVSGQIESFQGVPQIEITAPDAIRIVDGGR